MKSFILTAALMAATALAHAQPGSGGPTPVSTPADQVPLDGGASLLLASGAAYGLRKLRQRRAR